MQIGDIVKSHDFPGVYDCYMIGRIVGIYQSEGTFRARLLERVWQGKTHTEFQTDYFTAPLQGNSFMDDVFERVVVLSQEQADGL